MVRWRTLPLVGVAFLLGLATPGASVPAPLVLHLNGCSGETPCNATVPVPPSTLLTLFQANSTRAMDLTAVTLRLQRSTNASACAVFDANAVVPIAFAGMSANNTTYQLQLAFALPDSPPYRVQLTLCAAAPGGPGWLLLAVLDVTADSPGLSAATLCLITLPSILVPITAGVLVAALCRWLRSRRRQYSVAAALGEDPECSVRSDAPVGLMPSFHGSQAASVKEAPAPAPAAAALPPPSPAHDGGAAPHTPGKQRNSSLWSWAEGTLPTERGAPASASECSGSSMHSDYVRRIRNVPLRETGATSPSPPPPPLAETPPAALLAAFRSFATQTGHEDGAHAESRISDAPSSLLQLASVGNSPASSLYGSRSQSSSSGNLPFVTFDPVLPAVPAAPPLGRNLLVNPQAEQTLEWGWRAFSGEWGQGSEGSEFGRRPHSGSFYFCAPDSRAAKLYQDVDVAGFPDHTPLVFRGHCAAAGPGAEEPCAQVVVEYLRQGRPVLAYDSGRLALGRAWEVVSDGQPKPPGCDRVRVWLVAWASPTALFNAACFDSLHFGPTRDISSPLPPPPPDGFRALLPPAATDNLVVNPSAQQPLADGWVARDSGFAQRVLPGALEPQTFFAPGHPHRCETSQSVDLCQFSDGDLLTFRVSIFTGDAVARCQARVGYYCEAQLLHMYDTQLVSSVKQWLVVEDFIVKPRDADRAIIQLVAYPGSVEANAAYFTDVFLGPAYRVGPPLDAAALPAAPPLPEDLPACPVNLVANPTAALPLDRGWTAKAGAWAPRGPRTGGLAPPGGGAHFAVDDCAVGELWQDVDVAEYPPGTQFHFACWLAAGDDAIDRPQVVVEYCRPDRVVSQYNTGLATCNHHWQLFSDTRRKPAGVTHVRIRLLAHRCGGGRNAAYFARISFGPVAIPCRLHRRPTLGCTCGMDGEGLTGLTTCALHRLP